MAKAGTTTPHREPPGDVARGERSPWMSASKLQAARRRELTEAIRQARAA
jgi:hypothetical protein